MFHQTRWPGSDFLRTGLSIITTPSLLKISTSVAMLISSRPCGSITRAQKPRGLAHREAGHANSVIDDTRHIRPPSKLLSRSPITTVQRRDRPLGLRAFDEKHSMPRSSTCSCWKWTHDADQRVAPRAAPADRRDLRRIYGETALDISHGVRADRRRLFAKAVRPTSYRALEKSIRAPTNPASPAIASATTSRRERVGDAERAERDQPSAIGRRPARDGRVGRQRPDRAFDEGPMTAAAASAASGSGRLTACGRGGDAPFKLRPREIGAAAAAPHPTRARPVLRAPRTRAAVARPRRRSSRSPPRAPTTDPAGIGGASQCADFAPRDLVDQCGDRSILPGNSGKPCPPRCRLLAATGAICTAAMRLRSPLAAPRPG